MDWQELSTAEKEAARLMAWESLIGFIRVFYTFLWQNRFDRNWHHDDIAQVCEDAYFGRSKRDIINVSPGGTKTDLVGVCFPAWAIYREYERARKIRKATGSRASLHTRWLEVSYSGPLVEGTSSKVLEIMRSEPYQYMVPNYPDPKRGAAADWKVWDADGGGHEMFALSVGGQVTGRSRAGFMREGFSGALIIDDPMPPRDERSFAKKDTINRNLNRVVRNRLNHPRVPIIMIQQRVSTGDQTDFLRGAKSLDDYRLTKLPALITPKVAAAMPLDRRQRMVSSTGYNGEPVSYWESQVDTEYLLRVQENDAFLFSSQYQQAPDEAMLEGVIFAKEMQKLIADGRDGRLKILPHVGVDSYWDLGINDDMAITLVQSVGRMRHVIGAYHNNNLSLEHYLVWMLDYQEKFGIRWGKHYGPHDLKNRGKFTAKSDRVVALEAGLKFEPEVPRPPTKRDAIEATRRIFPMICIDRSLVELDAVNPDDKQRDRWLWAALERYHRKYDAENEVFSNEPAHDWASNPVDSFMLMGLVYKSPKFNTEEGGLQTAASFWSR